MKTFAQLKALAIEWVERFIITPFIVILFFGGAFGLIAELLGGNVRAEWLLVYLTGVYSSISWLLMLSAIRSAEAASRTADVMERSLKEQESMRIAQFFPMLVVPEDGLSQDQSGNVQLTVLNPTKRPVLGLTCFVWECEGGPLDSGVKYSSVLVSDVSNIKDGDEECTVVLKASVEPERDKVFAGDFALEEFSSRFSGKRPEKNLIALVYNHTADSARSLLLFDRALSKQSSKSQASLD